MTRPFAPAFLQSSPDAATFLHPYHADAKARVIALQQRAKQPCHPSVLEALHLQHPPAKRTAAQEASLQALATTGTTAVISGQQVGLFLGPLYTLHKAATAILLARQLEAETQQRVVPIFWLQVEDHDLEEIATCCLPQHGDVLSLRLLEPSLAHQNRSSVAHYPLEETALSEIFSQLQQCLQGLPFAQETLDLLHETYKAQRPIGEAFAALLHEIFASEGLLIFHPRHPSLASLAAPVHQRAISEASAIEARLKEREEALQQADFRVQIPLRPGATLSFFHPEGPEGPRFRIMQEEQQFALAGSELRFSQDQLLEQLQKHPERFSTSALLRPLLQDQWFPTAAYVGGPGEIAYFAQLAPLYQLFDVAMPMILPRGRFVWVESSQQKLLDQLGLTLEDLQAPETSLLARLAEKQDAHPLDRDALRAKLWEPLQQSIEQLQESIQQLEPGLVKPLLKLGQQFEDGLEKLVTKIQRVQLSQDEQTQQRLQSAKQRLFPQGAPQERVYGFPYFAARVGLQSLKHTLLSNYHPYQHTTQVLHLQQENG
ncbi:MAG: bacillithiol biosynthesis cysteine-adding enzyme BshC [Myxococcales bacterium]|nr:bacillithiol biosynthesis cysteine-adding enzyme BshC [Myxococcales bacterium]MCB9643893.1 bacillithiol biosynthesis cysteine-adding enzyme BshC [Myxococcales bacterium]